VDVLSAIISTAQELFVTHKTYALFADLILCATHSASATKALLLPSQASTLLIHFITALRSHPDSNYDTSRASRWIRCLVQLSLDSYHNSGISSEERNIGDPLKTVEDIVNQGLILARDSLEAMDIAEENSENGKYPAEELEWLSTTIFNLAVDFYVSGSNYRRNASSKEGTIEQDEETVPDAEAKKWAYKAVEIADVLARYPREEGGDKGLLARVLRRKMAGLGWPV
jgi:hypothetical protein